MTNIDRLRKYADSVREENDFTKREIIARVAGVSFEGRQDLLKKLKKTTPIKVLRDRKNKHDFYAVKVMAKLKGKWEHIGFLPRKMAFSVSKNMDKGVSYTAKVHRISGGGTSEYTGEELFFGLDIKILSE